MISLLKLGVLMLSYLGYWEYFRTRHKINIYFVPVFTIACQFVALLAAGILNYLKDTTVLLWVVGIVLFANALHREKLNIVRPYLTGAFVSFAVLLAVAAVYTYGKKFSYVDNFTHWATAVRNMLNTDRFPGSLDTAVEYTSYPLGSSSLIYYFCRLTSCSEHMQMLAQSFMMLCTILPVYAFVKKHKVISTALITIMTVFFFQYNIPITELLVDTLLPLAGMATITFVYRQCVIGENGNKLPVYYALPMMLWMMNIKHAALLYVVVAFALLCVGPGRTEQNRKPLLYSLLVLVVTNSLWNRHCSYIDPDVRTSQHALSVNWFSRIVSDKTPEDILEIIRKFLNYTVARRELLWFLVWLLLLGVLTWLMVGKKKEYLRFSVCVVSMYVIYAAALLGMYIFSMPVTDGIVAVDRYSKSGDIAIYYLMLLFSVSTLERVEKQDLVALAGITLLAVAVVGWRFQTGEYNNLPMVTCSAEERARWEAPIAEYGMVKRQSYLICIRQEDDPGRNNVPMHVWRYNMETAKVDQIVIVTEEQLEIEKEFDYVVILDEDNPVIQKWVHEHYPDKVGSQVIQHFT